MRSNPRHPRPPKEFRLWDKENRSPQAQRRWVVLLEFHQRRQEPASTWGPISMRASVGSPPGAAFNGATNRQPRRWIDSLTP